MNRAQQLWGRKGPLMSFQKQTTVLIMIAWNAFGCSVDIPDVAVVIRAGTPRNRI